MRAIAACVRLHNLCVDIQQSGELGEWTVDCERAERMQGVQDAVAKGELERLEELAEGGTRTDYEAHEDAHADRSRSSLDATQQATAFNALGSAAQQRVARGRHPEHDEERSHTRPVAAAAQTRHDIAEALAAAGETRTTGKATAQQNRGR
jgi:hypothetical protein